MNRSLILIWHWAFIPFFPSELRIFIGISDFNSYTYTYTNLCTHKHHNQNKNIQKQTLE